MGQLNVHYTARSNDSPSYSYDILLAKLVYLVIIKFQLLFENLLSVMAQVWSCPFGSARSACHDRQYSWQGHLLSAYSSTKNAYQPAAVAMHTKVGRGASFS